MTQPSMGIHSHPKFKIGKRSPKRAPSISFSAIRSDSAISAPIIPTALDDTGGVTFGLDGNDKFGVCVPTGFDNFQRMETKLLAGKQINMTQQQIFDWYKEQNPDFDPATGAGDNGMDIQTFLEARVKAGDILAFASVNHDNEDEVKEAVWLFLGILLGVNLEIAQQRQTEDNPPVWTWTAGSGTWGGHCVLEPAYEVNGNEDVITWAMRVGMSQSFIKYQRDEAWVVITQEHIDHPTFREGIDISKLASEYKRLTGRDFPVTPEPTPTPAPPTPAPTPAIDVQDQALWNVANDWVENHKHTREARDVANALRAWAIAKGLSPS